MCLLNFFLCGKQCDLIRETFCNVWSGSTMITRACLWLVVRPGWFDWLIDWENLDDLIGWLTEKFRWYELALVAKLVACPIGDQ